MELMLNNKTGPQYLDDLIKLFSKFKQQMPENTFTDKINPYLLILQFQLNTGIIEQIKINDETGIPTNNELSKIFAQKTILERKKQGVLSLKEIRKQLINNIDSNNTDFEFSNHLQSIANNLNISKLEEITENLNLNSTPEVLEIGHNSDLIGIQINGYSQLNKTFIEYGIELYVPKKKSKKVQTAFKTSETLKHTNWFGLRSDEIFELFKSEENIESVRSVERKIIGPYISKKLIQSEITSQYNPNLQLILESADLLQNNHKALFHHTDLSTPNYFDDSKSTLPQIEVKHKYITIDESSKQFLQSKVNSEQVI